MIRPYRPEDAAQLAAVHNLVYPDQLFSPESLRAAMKTALDSGGFGWTMIDAGLIGFAAVTPVPGLPHIGELTGFIAPEKQRLGYGTRLLLQIIDDLNSSPIRQISYQVKQPNSPAVSFFTKNRFFVEHQETILVHKHPAKFLNIMPVNGLDVCTYPRGKAESLFCDLFQRTFSDLPWDQPYSMDEVVATLDQPEDIIFLLQQDQPAGFAWLHNEEDGMGIIEPFGIIPEYQGQGFGRFLLQKALQEFARKRMKGVQIGAWKENSAAVHLYQSLGFKLQQTITYLAYNLPAPLELARK